MSSLKYQDGLISRKICVVDIQYLTLPWCQATITSHLIFLNVQVQCQTSPPHLSVWKYGESTKFLTHFLLANQISGVLYLSFHSKDVLFFYATLLLPLHFSLLWQCYVVVGQNVWGQLVQQHLEQPARERVWTNHSHRLKLWLSKHIICLSDPKTINTILPANLPRMTINSIWNLQLIF